MLASVAAAYADVADDLRILQAPPIPRRLSRSSPHAWRRPFSMTAAGVPSGRAGQLLEQITQEGQELRAALVRHGCLSMNSRIAFFARA